MRIAGSVLTLICGIIALVGVFMPWAQGAFFTTTGSGWHIIDVEGISVGAQPFMVLLAGILVIGFALPSFIVSMVTGRGKVAVVTLSTLASIASIVALGGAIWFIIDVLIGLGSNFQLSAIGYGVYVSAAAALVGMICAFVTLSAAIAARPKPRVARPAPTAAPEAAAPPPPPTPVAPPPPPPPAPEPIVEVAKKEPAPVVAEETPPPPPPPAPEPAVEKVKPAPDFGPAAVAPAAEEAKAPAPEKPKKPAAKKAEKAPSAKPEGIDESTLPMVQQPWETPAEFRARKKRKTVQF